MPFAAAFPTPTQEQWRLAVDKVLRGAAFDDVMVDHSADGIAIRALYPKAPGQLTAGRRAGTPWPITARLDHPDPDTAAASALVELTGGASVLALVMEGSRSARGYGLPRTSAATLDAALAGVDIELIGLRLEPGRGTVDAALVAALIERRGLAAENINIDFGIDPIGEASSSGLAPSNAAALSEALAGTFEALRRLDFRAPLFCADGRAFHEAGASEAQELACVLATLVAYMRGLAEGGISLSDARSALSVAMSADTDQYLTIAKFRALRRLWSRAEAAFALSHEPLAIHAETSWRMMTKYDPWANILRSTVAAFSAVVGGADTLTVLPFSHACGLPDAFSRRVARNTQLILQHEANLWRVVDPCAGSGGIEVLTDEMCAAAWTLFQTIEREGGMLRALGSGLIETMLRQSRDARAETIARRARLITGTSAFPNPAEQNLETAAATPAQPDWSAIYSEGREGFRMAFNQFRGVTMKASDLKRRDEQRAVLRLPSVRLSEAFETLRGRADAMAMKSRGRPKVLILALGGRAEVAGQAAFATDLFNAGGIETHVESAVDRPEGGFVDRIVQMWRSSGTRQVCLCPSDAIARSAAADAIYPGDTLIESIARRLTQAGAAAIWLYGGRGTDEAVLRSAGVFQILYEDCDAVAVLRACLSAHVSRPTEP